uniref:Uncharacterized protein n=1 Tax=Sipha flava TaxID=143950 RepID=A0A2S2QSP6_9HEMI
MRWILVNVRYAHGSRTTVPFVKPLERKVPLRNGGYCATVSAGLVSYCYHVMILKRGIILKYFTLEGGTIDNNGGMRLPVNPRILPGRVDTTTLSARGVIKDDDDIKYDRTYVPSPISRA